MKTIAFIAIGALFFTSLAAAGFEDFYERQDPYGNQGWFGSWNPLPDWPPNAVDLLAQSHYLYCSVDDSQTNITNSLISSTCCSLEYTMPQSGEIAACAGADSWSYYTRTVNLMPDSDGYSSSTATGNWSFRPLSSDIDLYINIDFQEWNANHTYSKFSITDLALDQVIWSETLQENQSPFLGFNFTIYYPLTLDPTRDYRFDYWSHSSANDDGPWYTDCDIRLISAHVPVPAAVYLALTGMGCLLPTAFRKRRAGNL